VLNIEQLTVRYGAFLALDQFGLHVDTGEIVGLIGPNGAGKSSVVRAIAGLVTPASGRIVFDGRSLTGVQSHERIQLGISVVLEGRGLFPLMSVGENLLMGAYTLESRAKINENMVRCHDLFPVLRERLRQQAGTLSGGQQQMLAVSMGLMSSPRILILDEPSLGLAPIVVGEIGRALRALRTIGMTILLVEQNAKLTASVADRIYVIQSGAVRYHDTPDRLFADAQVAESFLSY
jgi:branched-chain amino acid transport system ATP-binding protein